MSSNIRPLKERISITIDSDIVAELRNLSEKDDRSFSQYINGSHTPSNISSGKIAAVLKVNPLWLMGFDVPKYESEIIVPNSLSPEEISLLNAYRSSSEEIKTAACAVLGITRKKGSSSVSNKIG